MITFRFWIHSIWTNRFVYFSMGGLWGANCSCSHLKPNVTLTLCEARMSPGKNDSWIIGIVEFHMQYFALQWLMDFMCKETGLGWFGQQCDELNMVQKRLWLPSLFPHFSPACCSPNVNSKCCIGCGIRGGVVRLQPLLDTCSVGPYQRYIKTPLDVEKKYLQSTNEAHKNMLLYNQYQCLFNSILILFLTFGPVLGFVNIFWNLVTLESGHNRNFNNYSRT